MHVVTMILDGLVSMIFHFRKLLFFFQPLQLLLSFHFFQKLAILFLLFAKSLILLIHFLSTLQLGEEVTVLMQEEGHIFIGVHFYLLAHFEAMVDLEVKFALELFLIYLRFLCHESLVL